MDQREQQGADMRSVDIRVGHEDHPAVARLVDVEGPARAGSDHLDDRGTLGVLEHLGERGLLDVEDLASDRQQRLEFRVSGHLGRAERAISLDDEELCALLIVATAVDEFGRQSRRLEGILTPLRVALSACCHACPHRTRNLLEHRAGRGLLTSWRLRQPLGELLGHDRGDDAGCGRGAKDLLGLSLELRLRHADSDHTDESFEHVILRHGLVTGLEDPG